MNKDQQRKVNVDDIQQAIEGLPSKWKFEDLCRKANAGNPDAINAFNRLVAKTPELLNSIADLVEVAKALVIEGTSADSHLMRIGLDQKLSKLLASLSDPSETDAIKLMNTEILVVSYLDVMRCSLLAAKPYETRSDAEHFQKIADRAQKRYERALKVYSQHFPAAR